MLKAWNAQFVYQQAGKFEVGECWLHKLTFLRFNLNSIVIPNLFRDLKNIMYGEKKLKQIAEKVLGFSKADQTEVLLSVAQSSLTRFANNQIHQNMAWDDLGISVRVVNFEKKSRLRPSDVGTLNNNLGYGGRVGVSTTNSFKNEDLIAVVSKATKLADLQEQD